MRLAATIILDPSTLRKPFVVSPFKFYKLVSTSFDEFGQIGKVHRFRFALDSRNQAVKSVRFSLRETRLSQLFC